MRIAVEATRLVSERRGIGRYVRNLLRAMPLVRPDVRFTLHAKERDIAALRAQVDAMPGSPAGTEIEPIGSLRSTSADVAWYPWNWILHPADHARMVVSIMDLVPMLQFDDRWWRFTKRRKARRRSERTVKLASRILTISHFTAHEVTRLLGVPPERMRVTWLAADDFEATPLPESETLRKLGIEGPFFLAVGAEEARKNLEVLFRAMQRLHDAGERAPLVLCGPGARLEERAREQASAWLRYAGYVSDAELATLYARTTALVFPSRYEGFGLPVLEGLAAGAPVVCSNASSLPEVGGDAALWFDPDDDAALAAHMRRLLREPALRASLLAAAPAQVAKFSWRKCAEETLAGMSE